MKFLITALILICGSVSAQSYQTGDLRSQTPSHIQPLAVVAQGISSYPIQAQGMRLSALKQIIQR